MPRRALLVLYLSGSTAVEMALPPRGQNLKMLKRN